MTLIPTLCRLLLKDAEEKIGTNTIIYKPYGVVLYWEKIIKMRQ